METLYAAEAGHRNNLDFLRFIFATAVVFSHCFVVYTGDAAQQPFRILSHHQLGLGTVAINFFFIISGFLISQSWDRSKNFISFLRKRVLRIFPGFIFVCVVGALLFAPLGRGLPVHFVDYWSAIDFKYFLYRTLTLREPLLPATFKTLPYPNAVNGSLWSISYEFVCYLVIPLCAVVGIFKKPLRVALLLAVVVAVNLLDHTAYQTGNANAILGANLAPAYFAKYGGRLLNFEHLLLPFVAGMCFYAYRQHIPRSAYLVVLSIFVLVVTTRWFSYFEMAQALFGTYLLFYIAFSKRIHFHSFSRPGDFSYGIYLFGWPVQQVVMFYAGSYLNVYSYFLVTMALTLPLAAISWYLVEKPFLRLKRKPAVVTRAVAVG